MALRQLCNCGYWYVKQCIFMLWPTRTDKIYVSALELGAVLQAVTGYRLERRGKGVSSRLQTIQTSFKTHIASH
jgi:hypothetical protein